MAKKKGRQLDIINLSEKKWGSMTVKHTIIENGQQQDTSLTSPEMQLK